MYNQINKHVNKNWWKGSNDLYPLTYNIISNIIGDLWKHEYMISHNAALATFTKLFQINIKIEPYWKCFEEENLENGLIKEEEKKTQTG